MSIIKKGSLFPNNSESVKEAKSLVQVVFGLISAGITLLYAQPKTGKTVIATAIAIAIATGKKFCNRKVKKGLVLYLALDDLDSTIQKRLGKVKSKNLRFFNYKTYISTVNKLLDIRKAELAKQGKVATKLTKQQQFILFVTAFCKEEGTPVLVVVDTFQKIRSTNGDPKYNKEVNELEEFRQTLCSKGINILLIHHSTKDLNNPTPTGTNGLKAECDCSISVVRNGKEVVLTPESNSFSNDSLYCEVNYESGTVTQIVKQDYELIEMDPDIKEICSYISKKGSWKGTLADLGLTIIKNPTLHPSALGKKIIQNMDLMRSLGIFYKSGREKVDGHEIRVSTLIKVNPTIGSDDLDIDNDESINKELSFNELDYLMEEEDNDL